MAAYKLVIANRNYSSWSLRAWLFLRASGIAFEEIRIPMFTDTWISEIAQYSPAGRVPVLIHGALTVWDSTAIFQYLRELHPESVGWPHEQPARVHAQSIAAEMHSGFLAIREELPQNIRARPDKRYSEVSDSCKRQIARIDEVWSNCRAQYRHRGAWLFGDFSLADIMFVPVALRFQSYGIPISDSAAEFQDAVVTHPLVAEWAAAAEEEVEAIGFIDDLAPAAGSPLTLG